MCDTCVVQVTYEELWPENREAWDLFATLSQPAVREYHLGGWVFDRVEADDPIGLLKRIEIIRSTLEPPTHGP